MLEGTDNRAVSALFRVFGRGPAAFRGDACMTGGFRGMHAGEFVLLAVWVPLSVLVAVGDALCAWLGTTVGLMLALPAAFLALNLLPCALGGRSPASQWRRWLLAGVVWAVFHLDAGGVVAAFAWALIALFVLNALAWCLWLLKRSFEWNGVPGVVWRVLVIVVPHLILLGAVWKWGALVFAAGGALLAGLYCLAVLRPCCGWLGPVACRTGGKSILITIDDGPDPHDTPLLLDLLDQHGVKAVFFMIGEKAAAHPELVREVVVRGHEIGNHTMTHPQATFWCAGPWRTWREIAGCQKVIEDITGKKPRWFRAPVGHRNFFTHPVAAALGMKVMAWNRRGYDAVEKDVCKVLARILPGLGPGDIVLLHESTPIAAEVLLGVLEKIEHRRFNVQV